MEPILENEDLKEEIKQLKEELEKVKAQRDETRDNLVRCDAMLGIYVEKLKTVNAQLVWYEAEAHLSEQSQPQVKEE